MIHEEICTYEVAMLAKEKGFNLPSYFYYCREELSNDGYFCCHNKGANYVCAAPTQALLQRWLREEKKIEVVVLSQNNIGKPYFGDVYTERGWENKLCDGFATYELALEDGLKYALENLVDEDN